MNTHTGKWVGVMLHHTAGKQSDTVASIRKIHKEVNGWGDIGYHYVLEIKKGKGYLKKGRDTKYQGAHAGVDYYNNAYIGIVVPGNYCTDKLSDTLYSDLLSALCTLIKKFSLTHLRGHKEVKSTACPGDNIDLDKLRKDVTAKLKASGYNVNIIK